MVLDRMHLLILMPTRVFADVASVRRIVAEARSGMLGIWPNRLDCVVALDAGIFTYESDDLGEVNIAVDEGVLVKTGGRVQVSVRNAVGGGGLDAMRDLVERQFRQVSEEEKDLRASLARLESDLIRRFQQFRKR